MKRSIFTLFLTLSLFALCALPASAKEIPMPSFEERKEMAIETAMPHLEEVKAEYRPDWNLENLTVEAYPCQEMFNFAPDDYPTVEEVASQSSHMILVFYSNGQPMTVAEARYLAETGEMSCFPLDAEGCAREIDRAVRTFNGINAKDSPICIARHYLHAIFLYGNTVYGDHILLEASRPDNTAPDGSQPYFRTMDTDGFPLIMAQDFGSMIETLKQYPHETEWEASVDFLPMHSQYQIQRSRWIFGTAGVLLLIGFIGYRVYHSNRRRKRK